MEDSKGQIPFLGISIKSNNKNFIWMELDYILIDTQSSWPFKFMHEEFSLNPVWHEEFCSIAENNNKNLSNLGKLKSNL